LHRQARIAPALFDPSPAPATAFPSAAISISARHNDTRSERPTLCWRNVLAERSRIGQSVWMQDSPTFDQINVVVRDMRAMLTFYRLLGLEIADFDPGWEHHHRKVTTGDGFDIDFDSQAFAQQWNRGWRAGTSGAVIGFRVVERSTVDELFQRLTSAGYEAQQEPYDAFWGARYAVVADPDGNSVGIMSAADPSRRSRPTPPPS